MEELEKGRVSHAEVRGCGYGEGSVSTWLTRGSERTEGLTAAKRLSRTQGQCRGTLDGRLLKRK